MSTTDTDPSAPEAAASEEPAEPRVETASLPPPPSESPSEAAGRESGRPKKRRRKRRTAPDKVESEMRPELDASGRERPRFLLAFPKDPELEKLIAAFETGNYAGVRALAPKLIEHSEEEEVRGAAREILRRIEPDPLVKLLLFAALALFAIVVVYIYQSHG